MNKELGSPTRTMQMRQSKINHSVLQKRYREDDQQSVNNQHMMLQAQDHQVASNDHVAISNDHHELKTDDVGILPDN